MGNYVLNLTVQQNGDYEVHAKGCYVEPTLNVESLGYHPNCTSAVLAAKSRHPYKKINGCVHCSKPCHTS